MSVPFTVSSDMPLGNRIAPYMVTENADVIIRAGDIPDHLDDCDNDPVFSGTNYQTNRNNFLLNVPNGVRYWVKDANTVIYQRADDISDREVALFLLGSAWGALCYQRDLLPLHASAVIIDDAIHAFTGPSGAGKSTLSAALADRGFDFFTDDILIIDTADNAEIMRCYTGQKDLKLWKDALDLTGAVKGDAVRDVEGFEKFFATPKRSENISSGQLASLNILTSSKDQIDDEALSLRPIIGGASVIQLAGSVYRPHFANAIWGRKKLYTALGRLIQQVTVQKFARPFLSSEFDRGIDFLEHWLNGQGANALAPNQPQGADAANHQKMTS